MAIRWTAIWAVALLLGVAMPVLAQDDEFGGDEMGDDGTGDDGVSEEASGEASLDDVGGGGDGAEKPISIALLVGYGLDISNDSSLNPFGLGFGVRGGYNIDAIYLGARFVFFLGDSEGSGAAEVSFNVMTIGIEGGYDIDLDGLIIRPELGLGLAISSAKATISIFGMSMTADTSSEDVYVAPGAAVLGCVSDSIFIGGDLQFPIILADSSLVGLTILATGGMKF